MGGGFPMGGADAAGLQALRSPEMMEQQAGEVDMGSQEHCGSCRFFSAADSRCLYNPPIGNQWSMVDEHDWCGKYEGGEPHVPHVDMGTPGEQGAITEESSFA